LQSIPDDKVEIEFILAAGSTFEEAFDRWGSALRQYHGKDLKSQRDMARKYLGKKKLGLIYRGAVVGKIGKTSCRKCLQM
jgi:hypothetical protein